MRVEEREVHVLVGHGHWTSSTSKVVSATGIVLWYIGDRRLATTSVGTFSPLATEASFVLAVDIWLLEIESVAP